MFRVVGDKVVRILTTDAGYDQTDVEADGCEKRPGYPWNRAPRPAESQGVAPPKNPDAN